VDQAVQTFGGAGLSQEYGVGALLVASRLSRIAPVSAR
jgi:alkylation response protein AidB-like acyl-CoA dehydrogenase